MEKGLPISVIYPFIVSGAKSQPHLGQFLQHLFFECLQQHVPYRTLLPRERMLDSMTLADGSHQLVGVLSQIEITNEGYEDVPITLRVHFDLFIVEQHHMEQRCNLRAVGEIEIDQEFRAYRDPTAFDIQNLSAEEMQAWAKSPTGRACKHGIEILSLQYKRMLNLGQT